jgi:SAM-dependent methyltransferase
VSADTNSRARFDAIFAQVARSRTLSDIWREVYGQEYPQDASPFSFVTVEELRWLAVALHVSGGQRFVDLACGRGGPSLWVARETGATVIGIDSSFVAIEGATITARARGVSPTAAFVAADARATGLRSESVDAVMSIDALQLMNDRPLVMVEVARVLKPGGRFAFTTWLARREGAGPPFPVDYRPLLEAAGMVLDACREPPNWEPRESAVFARIRERAEALRAELGDTVATMLASEAAKMPDAYPLIRRVNVVARKAG